MLVVALLAGTFVLGHIVRYDYAAIYYNLLETWRPVTAGYHHLVPNATWRHEGRYAIEGLYSGASVQIVFYNFARRWPPKPPGRFARRVCRPLLIPHERLSGQTLWCLALSWLWMIVSAAPVFLLGIWLLTVSGLNSNQIGHTFTLPGWLHADQSLLTTWQQPVLGFVCSFIGARTVVKGTAFHFQRLIIKERLEGGHTRPARVDVHLPVPALALRLGPRALARRAGAEPAHHAAPHYHRHGHPALRISRLRRVAHPDLLQVALGVDTIPSLADFSVVYPARRCPASVPGWPPGTAPARRAARTSRASASRSAWACSAVKSISYSVLSSPKRTVPSPSAPLLRLDHKDQRVVRMGPATAIR